MILCLVYLILVDRLARITARIVSPYQFGFIQDHHIEDCVALASDCVNMLDKKCYGGNLAMKIDICKTLDILDWFFLRKVFQAFGFSFVFVGQIDIILISSRLSVLISVVSKGYFRYSRGVRQGDLFPLFCLDCRGFSQHVSVEDGGIFSAFAISSLRGFIAPTHLL